LNAIIFWILKVLFVGFNSFQLFLQAALGSSNNKSGVLGMTLLYWFFLLLRNDGSLHWVVLILFFEQGVLDVAVKGISFAKGYFIIVV
jgi:hypothetical protein